MRESGYYWVKYFKEWIIVEWNAEYKEWYLFSDEVIFRDEEFEEIDGNKIVR